MEDGRGGRIGGCSSCLPCAVEDVGESTPLFIRSPFVTRGPFRATVSRSLHDKLLVYTDWYSLLVDVALNEWFVIPADLQTRETVVDSPSHAVKTNMFQMENLKV